MNRNLSIIKSRSKIFWIVGFVLILVVIVTILELTNTTSFLHERTMPLSANSNTKGEAATDHNQDDTRSNANTPTTPNNSDGSSQSSKDKEKDNASATLTLLEPSGTFVSNHRPNLSGSPAPNSVSSVCTTTPGAHCTISFTKDHVTKSLPKQVTDKGGSAYWTWELQDIGITAGTWRITAIAELNGEKKSVDDALMFEVSQ